MSGDSPVGDIVGTEDRALVFEFIDYEVRELVGLAEMLRSDQSVDLDVLKRFWANIEAARYNALAEVIKLEAE